MGERAAALAFLAMSGAYLVTSLGFPLGSAARPGPGFFPVAIGAFLCVVALAFVTSAIIRPVAMAEAAVSAGRSEGAARVAVAMAALLAFCALLPWVGYPAAAFLFMTALLRRLGGGAWPAVLLAAAASAAASYYLFGVLLGVPLPRGALFD